MDRRTFLRRLGRSGAAGAVVGIGSTALHIGESSASIPPHRVAASGGRGSTRVIWSVDTAERTVALTFDDGPTDEFTTPVLQLLDRYQLPATFFVIGELVERDPDAVRRLVDHGHEVGNHTYDHRSAEGLEPQEVFENVERGADAIAAVLGGAPRWMRPVKGHVTGCVLRAATRVGHDIAIWSVQRGRPTVVEDDDVEGVESHLTTKVHPGAIVLLHDGTGRAGMAGHPESGRLLRRRHTELAALPAVLERWLADGYRFCTLTDLVALEAPTGQPVTAASI